MGIIEDLLANPGAYVGLDQDPTTGRVSAAKIVVTPLPGGAGVSFDFESFNTHDTDRVRGHAEHAVLGRTHGGGSILVTGHIHADSVAVLRESEPGVFVMGAESSPFPLAIQISVPGPGKLVYVWSFGSPGGEIVERDRAELTLAKP
jgi:hypothetical protein